MSMICGYFGPGSADTLETMLQAVPGRGERIQTAVTADVGLGYCYFPGRRGHSPGLHREGSRLAACAGILAPSCDDPAARLLARLGDSHDDLADLDGAFSFAGWDGQTLRLARDPFGIGGLFYLEHAGALWFASQLRCLLAIPGLRVQVDPAAIHEYLTFSCCPNRVPVQGVRQLPPGTVLSITSAGTESRAYFRLREELSPALEAPESALKALRLRTRESILRRLTSEERVGLYLSGGIDSSAVGLWLSQSGVQVQAFSLDFGKRSVEREEAGTVAALLKVPLTWVPLGAEQLAGAFDELVRALDLPFGDAVTGPQWFLGKAARQAGLSVVFNGEGGDQLFGGWTSKPMISARVYAGLYEDESPEGQYLRSYHRFYGLEEQLYSPSFRQAVAGQVRRRSLLQPFLGEGEASTFLNRVRLADVSIKGSYNILPRMERMAGAWGLDARAPLFDRALAEESFRLPPGLKLHGACEKYILKLLLQNQLPEEIVWRRKFGMSVPVTDWALGGLAPLLAELLGPASLARRGWFRPEYVGRLLRGENEPFEARRRRIGERLWALAVLEGWLRHNIDTRRAP